MEQAETVPLQAAQLGQAMGCRKDVGPHADYPHISQRHHQLQPLGPFRLPSTETAAIASRWISGLWKPTLPTSESHTILGGLRGSWSIAATAPHAPVPIWLGACPKIPGKGMWGWGSCGGGSPFIQVFWGLDPVCHQVPGDVPVVAYSSGYLVAAMPARHSFNRVWVRATRVNSLDTPAAARNRNCRKPRACLIHPNTGSVMVLRRV